MRLPKPFLLKKLQSFALRAPIDDPVHTSFGVMTDRPAVLIRAENEDGIVGWGEVWCNFPGCGAEHRAKLIETEIAPRLVGRIIQHPREAFLDLSTELKILVNQSAEIGPISQALAGTDIALWDIASQLADQPLWKFLGGDSNEISVYASGIGPNNPAIVAKSKLEEGYREFKLKVGFNDNLDIKNLRSLRNTIGYENNLMVDVNQAWGFSEALHKIDAMSQFSLRWIEEPIPVDESIKNWKMLSDSSPSPLAGGENIIGEEEFRRVIEARIFNYLQPDIGKWGGISLCTSVAKNVLESGMTYCPHWMGGGLGLLASAHLLAAIGGSGSLEIDANPNPLQEKLFTESPFALRDGFLILNPEPGLGKFLNTEILHQYRSPNFATPN